MFFHESVVSILILFCNSLAREYLCRYRVPIWTNDDRPRYASCIFPTMPATVCRKYLVEHQRRCIESRKIVYVILQSCFWISLLNRCDHRSLDISHPHSPFVCMYKTNVVTYSVHSVVVLCFHVSLLSMCYIYLRSLMILHWHWAKISPDNWVK